MSRFRSIWQASVNATKKALTWNVDDWIPPAEKYIFNFNTKEELKMWHLHSVLEYGGMRALKTCIISLDNKSRFTRCCNLFYSCVETTSQGYRPLPWRSLIIRKDQMFDGFIDWDAYDTIAMKLRGDGRCYISTIYTENWVNSPGQQEGNSWQAFVFVPKDS